MEIIDFVPVDSHGDDRPCRLEYPFSYARLVQIEFKPLLIYLLSDSL